MDNLENSHSPLGNAKNRAASSDMRWWNKLYSKRLFEESEFEFAKQPAAVKAGWQRAMNRLGIFAAFGALIAVFAPTDSIDRISFLSRVAKWLGKNLTPGMDKYIQISDFPQVTTLYMTAMVLLLPIIVIAMLLALRIREICFLTWTRNRTMLKRLNMFVFSPGLCILLVILAVHSPFDFHSASVDRHATALHLMASYRLGLAFFGGIGFSGIAIFAVTGVICMLTPILIFLSNLTDTKEQ